MAAFAEWLAATPASQLVGSRAWITPAVQTVHILAIAALMGAVLMINLGTLGAVARDQSPLAMGRRYGGWIPAALALLLASGGVLIVGEPVRSLENPVFGLKMALLIAAVLLTLAVLRGVRRAPGAGRLPTKLFAACGLAAWVGIILAGRWIAYAT